MWTRQQRARFHGLVKRAWLRHCLDASIPPNRTVDYDCWYRDHLYSACKIRSTKTADSRQFRTLTKHFRLLTDKPALPVSVRISGFSNLQNTALTDLSAKAWLVVCRSSATGLHFDAWLDAELASLGVDGRTAHDRAKTFDSVMSHFATIANDEYWLDRTSDVSERRIKFLIAGQLEKLSRLTGSPVTWDYVRAIWTHADLLPALEDAPASTLRRVLQMLCVHRRRLDMRHHAHPG